MTASEWRLKLQEDISRQLKVVSEGADRLSGKMEVLQDTISKTGENSSGGGFLSSLRNVFRITAGDIMATIGKLYEFGAASVQSFNEQDQALGQLRATWKSTGGAVGLSIAEMKAQAESLQKTTLWGDEQTEGAQSLLLTFTNIKGTIFKDSIPAIQDMATKMGVDLKGATLQVGKALNDPIEGINALRRVGVSFTDEQRAGIKKLVAEGKTQEAQTLILTELNREFGGSSIAAAQSGVGFMKQLANEGDEVKEVFGELIVGVLKAMKPALDGIMVGIQAVFGWLLEHKSSIGEFFKVVIYGALAAGAAFTVLKIGSALARADMTLTNGLIGIGTLVTNGWTAATTALSAAWKSNPLGMVAAAIGLITAGVMYAWDTSENFRGFLYGFWASIKTIFSNIGEFFKTIFTPILDGVNAVREGRWGDAAKSFGKGLLNLATPVGIYNGLKEGNYKSVSESYNNAYKDGLHDFYVEKAQEKANEKKGDDSPYAALTTPTMDGSMPTSDNKQLDKGLSDVSGGGKSSRIINVTIQRLVEKVVVNTSTARESVNEIADIVQETLIKALSGAESAMNVNGQ